ncbi:hypothetical protein CR513_07664, partial [Mucuna pruriens]
MLSLMKKMKYFSCPMLRNLHIMQTQMGAQTACDISKFSEIDETFKHSIKLENNTKINVLGVNPIDHYDFNTMFILSARNQEKKEICFCTTTQDLYHLGLQILQFWKMVRALSLQLYVLVVLKKIMSIFLLEKLEAFHHFRCFKILIEKQSKLPIKYILMDKGGEFNSLEFNEFCKLNKIKKQLTTTYTMQQNR